MDKPKPLTSCAYAIALKNDFKGKWYSQNDTYTRGVNSNFQIQENREKNLEAKGESINNNILYCNKSQYLTSEQLNFS